MSKGSSRCDDALTRHDKVHTPSSAGRIFEHHQQTPLDSRVTDSNVDTLLSAVDLKRNPRSAFQQYRQFLPTYRPVEVQSEHRPVLILLIDVGDGDITVAEKHIRAFSEVTLGGISTIMAKKDGDSWYVAGRPRSGDEYQMAVDAARLKSRANASGYMEALRLFVVTATLLQDPLILVILVDGDTSSMNMDTFCSSASGKFLSEAITFLSHDISSTPVIVCADATTSPFDMTPTELPTALPLCLPLLMPILETNDQLREKELMLSHSTDVFVHHRFHVLLDWTSASVLDAGVLMIISQYWKPSDPLRSSSASHRLPSAALQSFNSAETSRSLDAGRFLRHFGCYQLEESFDLLHAKLDFIKTAKTPCGFRTDPIKITDSEDCLDTLTPTLHAIDIAHQARPTMNVNVQHFLPLSVTFDGPAHVLHTATRRLKHQTFCLAWHEREQVWVLLDNLDEIAIFKPSQFNKVANFYPCQRRDIDPWDF